MLNSTLDLSEDQREISLPRDLAFLRIIGLLACKWGRPSGQWPGLVQSLSFLPISQEEEKKTCRDQQRDSIYVNHWDCVANFTLRDVGIPGSAAASIIGRSLLYSLSRLVQMSRSCMEHCGLHEVVTVSWGSAGQYTQVSVVTVNNSSLSVSKQKITWVSCHER